MQKEVTKTKLDLGVVGEAYTNEGWQADRQTLKSADETLNAIGVVVTAVAGKDAVCGVSASTIFAGITCSPKTLARTTIYDDAVIKNGENIEVAQAGSIIVNYTKKATIGDFAYYSNADGTIVTEEASKPAPAGHTRIPGGIVTKFNVPNGGLGVLKFSAIGDITSPTT